MVGWAWLSARTNSLTGARYGNFRSLAVAGTPARSAIGELLLAAVLEAAARGGLTQLTGKVHAQNLGMRALYRKFGFRPSTSRWRRSSRDPAREPSGQRGRRRRRDGWRHQQVGSVTPARWLVTPANRPVAKQNG